MKTVLSHANEGSVTWTPEDGFQVQLFDDNADLNRSLAEQFNRALHNRPGAGVAEPMPEAAAAVVRALFPALKVKEMDLGDWTTAEPGEGVN